MSPPQVPPTYARHTPARSKQRRRTSDGRASPTEGNHANDDTGVSCHHAHQSSRRDAETSPAMVRAPPPDQRTRRAKSPGERGVTKIRNGEGDARGRARERSWTGEINSRERQLYRPVRPFQQFYRPLRRSLYWKGPTRGTLLNTASPHRTTGTGAGAPPR